MNGKVGYKTVARGRLYIWIKNYRAKGTGGLKSKTGTKKGENKEQGRKKGKTREKELERDFDAFTKGILSYGLVSKR